MASSSFVTNRKVTLNHQPSRFRGCTVLWITNPADLKPYDQDKFVVSRTQGGEPLYDRLWESVNGVIGDLMWDRFLLCRLPAETAHITLCDLIHDENVSELVSPAKGVMQGILANLPGSANTPLPVPFPAISQLLPVTFCFDKLSLWGSVVVARLKPVEGSVAAFDMAASWRKDLDHQWAALGKAPLHEYTPHISLGYYANEALARQADAAVDVWSEYLQCALNGITITTVSARTFYFTDMWTFFAP